MRRAVKDLRPRHDDRPVAASLSIGVTAVNQRDMVNGMIERADAALYQAKANGRDQVRTA